MRETESDVGVATVRVGLLATVKVNVPNVSMS